MQLVGMESLNSCSIRFAFARVSNIGIPGDMIPLNMARPPVNAE